MLKSSMSHPWLIKSAKLQKKVGLCNNHKKIVQLVKKKLLIGLFY
jgi:hypothetical protein